MMIFNLFYQRIRELCKQHMVLFKQTLSGNRKIAEVYKMLSHSCFCTASELYKS